METAEELELLLIDIFKQADADGNGWLDPGEFKAVMSTCSLGLSDSDVTQLMLQCDANSDGKIEYAEFVPVATEVVQAMRVKQLVEAEQRLGSEAAEMAARDCLHGLSKEELTAILLESFRSFDTDDSGSLSREGARVRTCSHHYGPLVRHRAARAYL